MRTRFYSYDLVQHALVDEIEFTEFRFSRKLNAAGGFSTSIATAHPKCDRAYFEAQRHAILVEVDDALRFAGIFWEPRWNSTLTAMTLGGEGLWSFFKDGRSPILNLNAPNPIVFTDVEQFDIVRFLMALCQGEASVKNLDVQVRTNGTSGVTRSLTIHDHELKDYGAAIEDIAAPDDGFDFDITPQWGPNNSVDFVLDLWHPRRGAARTLPWIVGTNVALAGDWYDPPPANRVHASGSNRHVQTAVEQAQGKLRVSKSVSYPNITHVPHLRGIARAELAREHSDVGAVTVTIIDHDELPFGSWDLGDTIPLIADRGYDHVDADVRVVEYDVTIVDPKGIPEVTVELGAA